MSDRKFGSEKDGYLLEILADAVFLTVYAPKENNAAFKDSAALCGILKENGIKDYNISDLVKILQEHSGVRTQLAGQKDKEGSDAKEESLPVPEVEISKDKMQASMNFPGTTEQFKYDRAYIDKLLADKGVVFGIDENKLKAFMQHPIGSQVIAIGRKPVNGQNAYVKKHIDFSKKGQPASGKYDKVDYKNLNLFFLVSKGDVLAQRIPQTKGEPGMNVLGKEIACRPGKPVPFAKGKNTELLDENTLIAAIDGQALDGKNISVAAKLEINGNVDVATGNINFNGSVFIKGNVEAGFLVKADGDVNVGGTVSGAIIEAQNIYVESGILGMKIGKIYAREDVRTSFVENANITAERDIYITDVALHSKINAGRTLTVKGKRGQIVGGLIKAGTLIDATRLGNTMNVVSKVEVGVNPIINKRYQNLMIEVDNDKKQLKNIKNALAIFAGKSNLTEIQKEKLQKLKNVQFPLLGNLERKKNELNDLASKLQKLENAKILIDDKVYPGVKILIESFVYTVQAEAQHCSFAADAKAECVKLNPY